MLVGIGVVELSDLFQKLVDTLTVQVMDHQYLHPVLLSHPSTANADFQCFLIYIVQTTNVHACYSYLLAVDLTISRNFSHT